MNDKQDMSNMCGMHYFEYWHAANEDGTMSEDEFHKWMRDNCYQCIHLCEICLKE